MGYNAAQYVEIQVMFWRSKLQQAKLAACFMLISCLAYPKTLKMEVTCSYETSFDFNGLYGVISQKTELFMCTGVRTSNHMLLT
jgi:hypothetical protein